MRLSKRCVAGCALAVWTHWRQGVWVWTSGTLRAISLRSERQLGQIAVAARTLYRS